MTTAIAVAIIGTLWLVRGGLSSGYPLYARFAWGQGLRTGQPVLLSGVSVGIVESIELERSGNVVVQLRIEGDHRIPASSQATIKANGIFGDMLIALQPTKVAPEDFAPGDTVPTGPPSPTIEAMLIRLDTIGRQVNDVTQAFEMQLVRGGGIEDLRKTMASTNRFVTQLSAIAAEQSRQLTLTMGSFRRSAAALDSLRIDSIMKNMEATSANMTRLTSSLDSTSRELGNVVAKVNNGTGTAGMLVNDTLLYANLKNAVARIDSLTADIKKNPRKYINLEIF